MPFFAGEAFGDEPGAAFGVGGSEQIARCKEQMILIAGVTAGLPT
jgi:hypothetical protein